ncbi:carotenoid 1,2-hydratase [Ectothiorhodospira lacustris]|uniref:carotenoid 1,2-hydratase n=1 Tax=Ectothiorhodospira lacustris TaxID=2899127 RepID=UPI003241C90B
MVTPGGYLWWYLDAWSDDGCHGITLIAFVGSVFSPYYALARRRGTADPSHHVSINVALYGNTPRRWAMTERGRGDLQRDKDNLVIGPSALEWGPDGLTVHLNEVSAPLPSRIRGTIRLHPEAMATRHYALDQKARHQWRPIAPCARVEVDLQQPGLRWQGHGYMDSNIGTEPLEQGFRYWDWSRAVMPNGDTVVLYEATQRDDRERMLTLRFDPRGGVRDIEPPPRQGLPISGWRVNRATRADDGRAAVRQTLTDTPFYVRSLLDTRIGGEPGLAFHESLSLERFETAVVQLMLPFRMPRRARG